MIPCGPAGNVEWHAADLIQAGLLPVRKPGRFGSEVVFTPESGIQLNPLARNKVAGDLIVRADRARNEASSSP